MAMVVKVRYQAAGGTDPGQKRQNNEDRYYLNPERGLFLVVDGVGGQSAGEKAAEIAVDMLRTRLERPLGEPAERLREAIAVANNAIYEAAQGNAAWRGMACVLTAALVEEDRVTIGHVGDSRLYLLRPGEIRKVTPDHSPVGEREDHGELSEAEAMRHPRRNEVYRDVGSEPHAPDDPEFIDIICIPFSPKDALVLCSDGVSDLVTSAEIRRSVEQNAQNPANAVKALIAAANSAGGKDNITAIVVTGSEFAGRTPATQAPAEIPTGRYEVPQPKPSIFARRWTFLIYGLLLGALVGFALQKPKPPQPAAVPKTWTVGGTASDALPTIAKALEIAQPGDTILVAPGFYDEAIQLREGVHLRSEVPGRAVLQMPTGAAAVISAIEAHTGSVNGFRIEAGAAHPLDVAVLCQACGVNFSDLQITGARKAAVVFEDNAWGTLQSSRITQAGAPGILVSAPAHPRLIHNILSGGNAPAIRIENGAKPVLLGNTFLAGTVEPIWKVPDSADDTIASQNYFWSGEKTPLRRKIRPLGP